MRITRIFTLGIVGLGLVASAAFAQNIQTNTTSTTVGSTQFGFVITPGQLATVMQATTAPTCSGPVDNRVCTSLGPDGASGTSDDFQRINALPGTHTSSPIAGQVSTLSNFACGPAARSNDCNINFGGPAGDIPQTAPNFTGRTLVGNLNIDIDLGGAGTAGMPTGSIKFTLNPSTGAATIDQLIEHTVSLGSNNMVFTERDRTVGYNNPIGGPLVPFTALDTQTGLPTAGTGLVTQLVLNQGNAGNNATGSFGGLNLDVTVNFPATATGSGGGLDGSRFPPEGTFVTPGLNTGIDSNVIPGADIFGFP